MTLSIVTCWRDAPELIGAYRAAVVGAQVIIVDHLSAPENAAQLQEMAASLSGVYVRDAGEWNFSRLNNRGLALTTGEVVLFLNNDIAAPPGWLAQVERDCLNTPGLCGPSRMMRQNGSRQLVYLEGWCIGAQRGIWLALGGWDESYLGGYWEDNDLCWRAIRAGYALAKCQWPVTHLNNYTSAKTEGAYDQSASNQARFWKRVRDES